MKPCLVCALLCASSAAFASVGAFTSEMPLLDGERWWGGGGGDGQSQPYGGGQEVSFVGREIDEKLFVRSAALQALMPMVQFSLLPTRRLSPEGVKLCRAFADLHIAFAPYIMELVRHASTTGEPIVRAMEYEFPHQGFNRPMQQFMLGGRWLVAPESDGDARVYRLTQCEKGAGIVNVVTDAFLRHGNGTYRLSFDVRLRGEGSVPFVGKLLTNDQNKSVKAEFPCDGEWRHVDEPLDVAFDVAQTDLVALSLSFERPVAEACFKNISLVKVATAAHEPRGK